MVLYSMAPDHMGSHTPTASMKPAAKRIKEFGGKKRR
jgi:hypothetical protein